MSDVYAQLQRRITEGTLLEGRYRVGEPIGSGAYGMIFAAVDETTGEQVAIKAIPPAHNDSSSTAHGRFQREMVVIRNLVHPNIISMYDWGETDDHYIFMVLEFIDGATLDDVVRHRPLTTLQAVDVTRQIALALQVAHKSGVIHRDLKPANVMLTRRRDGSFLVKVLDFGMAKLLHDIEGQSIVELTREGMAVGTPRYIAPEQARGLAIGPGADLYAVGLLLYEMLTGEQAVKAHTVDAAVSAHVSSKPLELPELADADAIMHPIVRKLLEKNVDKRFRDTGELLKALKEVEAVLSPAPRGPAPIPGAVALSPTPESKGGSQAKETTQPVPSQPGGDAPAAQALELDYEAYTHHAPATMDPRRRRRRSRMGHWFRLPRTLGEAGESLLALIIAPVAFILITAHFAQLTMPARYGVGLLWPAVALIWSLAAHSVDWRHSFFRLLWVLSFAAIFLAHVLGPPVLAQELLRNPTWFLLPLGEGPVVDVVGQLVTNFSRNYAVFIQTLWPFKDPALAVAIPGG
jgi:eukaryotic-like serine/threonine-protein kinase